MSSGLPWIRLYRDLAHHPKLLALECDLGEGALAYVIKLWCAAATHYRDGRIVGPPGLVARYAGWSGPPDTLISALVACGLFERVPEGLVCHDWDEYQGAHIERSEAEAARGRVRRASRGRPADVLHSVRSTPAQANAGRPVGRGEEIREDKKREDHDHEGAAAPASNQPVTLKAIWATRAEPISMYGPIPDTIGKVWAFQWREEDVAAHLKRAAPDLDETARWDQTEDCLNYRCMLNDRDFRHWAWPQGCIPRLVAWLERANKTHLDAQTARARAAKAGVYVADTKRT